MAQCEMWWPIGDWMDTVVMATHWKIQRLHGSIRVSVSLGEMRVVWKGRREARTRQSPDQLQGSLCNAVKPF